MKHLIIALLVLLSGRVCHAQTPKADGGADGAIATQEPARNAVLSKRKAKIVWDGESFRNVTYKQVGKRKLLLDIYLPDGRKSEKSPAKNSPTKSPVIYYVHGGGWAAGSKENFGNRLMLPVFRQLAEQGFVCVSIDYRLCKKGSGVLMRDCVTDAFDGLRFLKKHAEQYAIDPDRIVVFGDSAGGQLAQMLTYASPDEFKGDNELAAYGVQPLAGISWYGPTDFTDVNLFKTDLSDKNPDRFGARISGNEGGYAKNPQAFEAMSPYFWIEKDCPPLLVVQGDTDATIPLSHAIHLKEKADRIGADIEMVIVKNAGHNWRKAGGDPDPGLEEIQRITSQYALRQVEPKKGKLHAADFYVSPKGSDAWTGTLPEPDKAGTDGPFATLQRARDAVRELKKVKSEDIVVLVQEGTYQLQKTIVFGLEDSGVGDSTITYAAYPDETPVFSSGREITAGKK